MTSIQIEQKHIPIHIDTNGNLYFESNGNLFQLNVDPNNEPILESGNYDVVQENEIYIQKGKLVKTEKFVDDRYMPEDNGYSLVSDLVEDEFDETNEETQIEFYDTENKFTIQERENGQIASLYDVFVYDDTESNNLSKLIFRTKLHDEIPSYRVIIYTSGKFYFRPIGCMREKKYSLQLMDNLISVKCG